MNKRKQVNIKALRTGVKVVMNGREDATVFTVLSVDGFMVTIREGSYASQQIDYSLIHSIKKTAKS